jgi:serine/threonine protein kinase
MLAENWIGLVVDNKYKVERQLGRGGMGAVYLATHLGTDRPVALKVIVPQFKAKDEFVERFRREAKAAGRMRHPNVVDVTDFGFADVGGDQVAYLVMEYLDGCSLGDILAEESKLPLVWVVDIIEQVCAAVNEAHKRGIIHRDLKPDNIWMEPNRRGGYTVKVLDFGLAKLSGDGHQAVGPQAIGSAQARTNTGSLPSGGAALTGHIGGRNTAVQAGPATIGLSLGAKDAEEAKTQVFSASHTDPQSEGEEAKTQVFVASDTGLQQQSEEAKTQVFVPSDNSRPHQVEEAQTQIFVPSDNQQRSQTGGHAQKTDEGQDSATLVMAEPGTVPGDVGRTTKNTPGMSTGLTPQAKQALLTQPADGLTQVGSVLGTPIYMSPEQCRGEDLDARSDIYSIGVIAYQLIAGRPPFAGMPLDVINQHMTAVPIPLRKLRKETPRLMARTVMSALAKDPQGRPRTAAAFASAMRASLDVTSALFRHAMGLYSELFPKLFKVSILAHLPAIAFSVVRVVEALSGYGSGAPAAATRTTLAKGHVQIAAGSQGLEGLLQFLATTVVVGVTIRLVTQTYLAPLRPVNLKPALAAVRKRLWRLLWTDFMARIGALIGLVLLIVPGLILAVSAPLVAPVVMMENVKGWRAIKRSIGLVRRSWLTSIAILIIQYLIPSLAAWLSLTVILSIFKNHLSDLDSDQGQLVSAITGLVVCCLNVVIVPFLGTLSALLYLKVRMAGGEILDEMLGEFANEDVPKTKWQLRMRSSATGI